jgi:hypothetical protein
LKRAPYRLVGDLAARYPHFRCSSGSTTEVDIAADLAAGRLERVPPQWSGGGAPIVALYPTARHLPRKTRVFLDAMAARLAWGAPRSDTTTTS